MGKVVGGIGFDAQLEGVDVKGSECGLGNVFSWPDLGLRQTPAALELSRLKRECVQLRHKVLTPTDTLHFDFTLQYISARKDSDMSETAWTSDGHGGSIQYQLDPQSGNWFIVRRSRESYPPSLLGGPREEPSQPRRPNPCERRQTELNTWQQQISAHKSTALTELKSKIRAQMRSKWRGNPSRTTGYDTSEAIDSVLNQVTQEFPAVFDGTVNYVASSCQDPASTMPSVTHNIDLVDFKVARYKNEYDVNAKYDLTLSGRGLSRGPYAVRRSFPVSHKSD